MMVDSAPLKHKRYTVFWNGDDNEKGTVHHKYSYVIDKIWTRVNGHGRYKPELYQLNCA